MKIRKIFESYSVSEDDLQIFKDSGLKIMEGYLVKNDEGFKFFSKLDNDMFIHINFMDLKNITLSNISTTQLTTHIKDCKVYRGWTISISSEHLQNYKDIFEDILSFKHKVDISKIFLFRDLMFYVVGSDEIDIERTKNLYLDEIINILYEENPSDDVEDLYIDNIYTQGFGIELDIQEPSGNYLNHTQLKKYLSVYPFKYKMTHKNDHIHLLIDYVPILDGGLKVLYKN